LTIEIVIAIFIDLKRLVGASLLSIFPLFALHGS